MTGVLFKVALKLGLIVKARVTKIPRGSATRRGKLMAAALRWAVPEGSKLSLHAFIDFLLGDAVGLGGFV
ncbi:MAG: hypothetical protein LH645_07385 [Actinomycetia bacterium]|nr:hypothetical protein [Actinomycetes bacterium]